MPDILDDIPDSIARGADLPHPDWTTIQRWVAANVARDQKHSTWCAIARAWVDRLAIALGAGYSVSTSGPFLLLAPATVERQTELVKFADSAFGRIQTMIPWNPPGPVYGHRIILIFERERSYYSYLAHRRPDGEYGSSGGICVRRGYMHVCVNGVSRHNRRTILHELVHLWLTGRRTPLWIEEGVAELIPDILLSESTFSLDRELVARHRAFWNALTIAEFWSGDAFHRPDEGQELAYNLAQVLTRTICSDHRRAFSAFLAAANDTDSGAGAAREHLGLSLGDLMTRFLGPGPWS